MHAPGRTRSNAIWRTRMTTFLRQAVIGTKG
jgi:hypothetical protein